MMVMMEHDPNDDPFAGLYQEEPILVSPMEFGSGAINKPSMTVEQAQNTEEAAEEEPSESSTNEASSDEKEE
jgi:hypothetical protein